MRIGIPDGVFDDVLPGWKQKIADYFDHRKYNSSTKPSHLNDFENIDHTTGFWIHITNPDRTTFRYSGIKPTQNQKITLYPGWNLVGYPSLESYNRRQALNNLLFGVHVDAIWTYNAEIQEWEVLDEWTDMFQTGKGYWIYAPTECVWNVPL